MAELNLGTVVGPQGPPGPKGDRGDSGTCEFVNAEQYGVLRFGVDENNRFGYFNLNDEFVPFNINRQIESTLNIFASATEWREGE